MSLKAIHKEVEFGVGDKIKISQRITDSGKSRLSVFEGQVISIKGRGLGKNVVVRRIGANQIGIEKIFPLHSPIIEKIIVMRSGYKGVKSAKLYYIREKSRKEKEKIYSRSSRRKA